MARVGAFEVDEHVGSHRQPILPSTPDSGCPLFGGQTGLLLGNPCARTLLSGIVPPADNHTEAEKRSSSPAREPSKITRRTALALLGVATGTTALLHPSGAAPASAAVVWGHPFASYRTWSYGFGERDGRLHAGIDYPSAYSIPIHAVADGTVYNVGWHSGYGTSNNHN